MNRTKRKPAKRRRAARRSAFVVTRQQLARLLHCTPDQVSKRITEGLPGVVTTGGGRGRPTEIDLVEALPWLLERRAAAGDDERQRYFRLQGDKIEQEIRHRAGELVEAADVEQRWQTMAAAARERLLSLPAVALQRHLIDATAEDGLIALVDEALSELSQGRA